LRRIVLLFGVLQWSVLGVIFLLYTAELFDVVAECGSNSYADDTQIYVRAAASDHIDAIERLVRCTGIVCIRDWMARNRLKLNEDKTQVVSLGTRQQLNKATAQSLTLTNATVQFSDVVNDLGVRLDSQLTMANRIAALSRS